MSNILKIDPSLASPTMAILAMDFAIVFIVLLLVRRIYGVFSGVNMTEEIASKDNFAVGISLAGATGGIAIMLTGVVSGDIAASYGAEARSMIAYAAIGIVLMWVTRLIFDKVSLPAMSVKNEVNAGNVAVAVVEAGNLMATAIMIRAVMVWSEGTLIQGLIAVVVAYVATQIVLTATAYYRIMIYRLRNSGAKFYEAVQDGNLALALRFVGFQLGVALAVTAATGISPYVVGLSPVNQAITLGVFAIAAAVLLILLTLLAEIFVLRGINLSEEVDRQRNIGVALTEVAVYVGLGLLLATHLA